MTDIVSNVEIGEQLLVQWCSGGDFARYFLPSASKSVLDFMARVESRKNSTAYLFPSRPQLGMLLAANAKITEIRPI